MPSSGPRRSLLAARATAEPRRRGMRGVRGAGDGPGRRHCCRSIGANVVRLLGWLSHADKTARRRLPRVRPRRRSKTAGDGRDIPVRRRVLHLPPAAGSRCEWRPPRGLTHLPLPGRGDSCRQVPAGSAMQPCFRTAPSGLLCRACREEAAASRHRSDLFVARHAGSHARPPEREAIFAQRAARQVQLPW